MRPSWTSGDPGRVVAAVLQPAQALDHHPLGLLRSDVPDDSAHGRGLYRRREPRPARHAARPGLPQCGAWRPGQARAATGSPGPYVELDRDAWAALGRGHRAAAEPPRRSTGCAGSATSSTSTRWSRSTCRCRGCSACTPRAPADLHRAQEEFLHHAAAAAHAVRDRARRVGGGGQVDDRPGAAADARALAGAPVGRPGHHRRLPAPQRRARAPRPARPQGLAGVLRPAGAAAVRDGHQVGQGRGRGADVLPPRLRRGARRAGGRAAPGHRHRRGPQRAAARPGARRRPHRARDQRLLRLLGVRRRGDRRHPHAGTSTGSCGCGRPRSATRRRTSRATARLTEERGGRAGAPDLGRRQRPEPEAERAADPGRATLVLRKAPDHSVRCVRLRKL